MSPALIAACLWFLAATVTGLLPSRDHHWRAACGLVAIGLPVLGWVVLQNGPVVGLLVLAGAASVLRWPVVRVWRWVRRLTRPAE